MDTLFSSKFCAWLSNFSFAVFPIFHHPCPSGVLLTFASFRAFRSSLPSLDIGNWVLDIGYFLQKPYDNEQCRRDSKVPSFQSSILPTSVRIRVHLWFFFPAFKSRCHEQHTCLSDRGPPSDPVASHRVHGNNPDSNNPMVPLATISLERVPKNASGLVLKASQYRIPDVPVSDLDR